MNTELAELPTQELSGEVSSRGLQIRSFDELMSFCRAVANSKLAPRGIESPEAIMVAVQMGLELGLGPMQALQNIAVINGRPCVWGDAALALVKGHPECEDVIESFEKDGDNLTAVCTVQRAGKAPVTRKFSMANAKKAGLAGKAGPWTQYTTRMLQMRARSWALRDSFPDALKGVGIREEVQDIEPKPAKVREVAKGIVFPDEPAPAPQLEAPSSQPYQEGGDEDAKEDLF